VAKWAAFECYREFSHQSWRNKGPRNPLLAQASTELSQTYVPPAPVKGRSTHSTRPQNQLEIAKTQVKLIEEQVARIQSDEEVARGLIEERLEGGVGFTI
jgi:hypothetical protein